MLFGLLRCLYTLLFYLLLLFIFLRLYWKGRKLPAYRERWWERLGFIKAPKNFISDNIGSYWLHAVSLGEAITAVAIMKALVNKNPDIRIVLTTTTVTGSEHITRALSLYPNHHIIHSYLPYDIPLALNNFINKIRPKILLVMETEIWPNLFWVCQQKNIPIVIANARLSCKSVKNYEKARLLIRPLMQKVIIMAQTEVDALRYQTIGVPDPQITVLGNIKFDFQLPIDITQKSAELRQNLSQQLGRHRPIFIAASTHPGEEEIILAAFNIIKISQPECLLILVPRHPDRFDEVAKLCLNKHYTVVRRSAQNWVCPYMDIYLGDTMGELLLMYGASDVAFVGGSFVQVGGHNLLEPAALGLPVLTGPILYNFVEISELLIHSGHTVVVNNSQALAERVCELLANQTLKADRVKAGLKVLAQNRGALDKLIDRVLTVSG